MANQQLDQSFQNVVEDVWKKLKPAGFRKQGQRFRRQIEGNIAIIEFQRSQTSNASQIKFTLNLGILSESLANRLDPEKSIKKAGVIDAHLCQRIGDILPSKGDHWWLLSELANEAAIRREVAQCVVDFALPYLNGVRTDDALVALWRANRSPGLTVGQRGRYLALLDP